MHPLWGAKSLSPVPGNAETWNAETWGNVGTDGTLTAFPPRFPGIFHTFLAQSQVPARGTVPSATQRPRSPHGGGGQTPGAVFSRWASARHLSVRHRSDDSRVFFFCGT